jgi:hypothetical protein
MEHERGNQWRNGIADLEALLAAEDSDMDEDDELRVGQHNNGPPGVREIAFVVRNNNNRQHQQHIINPPAFPFLPPMIPPEDGLLDDEDN